MKRFLSELASLLGLAGDMAGLVKGAILVFAIRILGALLSYLLVVVLARWMGSFEFGVYVHAAAWVMILSLAAPLGFLQAVVRFIPEYLTKMEWARVAGVISTSRRVTLASALVFAAGGLAFLQIAGGELLASQRGALYVALACVPVIALVRLHIDTFRALGHPSLAYTLFFIVNPLIILFLAGLLVALEQPLDGQRVMAILLLAGLAVLFAQFALLPRILPGEVARSPAVRHAAIWLRVALPLVLLQGFGLVMTRIDIVMLAAFGSPETLALYGAAANTAGLIFYVPFAMVALATPKFSRLYANRNHPQLQALVSGTIKWVFWPSLLMALGILLVGKILLGLFGVEFVGAYPALALLAAVPVILAAAGPHEQLLSVTGNQVTAAGIFGCSILINCALNLILISRFDLIGAALATAATAVSHATLLVLAVRIRLGIRLLPFAQRQSNSA